jgi:hypothetical protein
MGEKKDLGGEKSRAAAGAGEGAADCFFGARPDVAGREGAISSL